MTNEEKKIAELDAKMSRLLSELYCDLGATGRRQLNELVNATYQKGLLKGSDITLKAL